MSFGAFVLQIRFMLAMLAQANQWKRKTLIYLNVFEMLKPSVTILLRSDVQMENVNGFCSHYQSLLIMSYRHWILHACYN